jgi:lipopolysaccharide assembly outer membrane protein LptD (OstA)
MDKRFLRIIFIVFFSCFLSVHLLWAQGSQEVNVPSALAEKPAVNQESSPQETTLSLPAADNAGAIQPIQIDGDNVEFMQEENKVVIDGHVSIVKGDTALHADHIEYHQAAKLASAKGHVVLTHPQGEIRGESLTFNFENMTGDFQGATIVAKPYYGKSEFISKVGENKIEMKRGYITTCDLDKPHYKMYAKKVTMVPGDKIQAESVRMVAGKMPLFYLPSFTQIINGKKPLVVYTPGYDKEWGVFLLTTWSYYLNDNFKGKVHLDYRQKKDFASGFDTSYKLPGFGEGLVKTYYMNERNVDGALWEDRAAPTVERERYKIEWRHKWQIDNTSQVVSQYYKLSDSDFLKDYFEREYDRDSDPDTFFQFTKNLDRGTFSFRVDKRVNRFTSSVERLPEIGYSLSNQKIANSNFYLQSNNLFSELAYPNASPTDTRLQTTRLESQNRISYPTKVGFIEFTPFVGQRETFYTKTKEPAQYNIIRSIFETGASLSTKFYRTFDIEMDAWGMKINKLRHIINPMVVYQYTNDPSFPAEKLNVFDSSIDPLTQAHKIDFSLENRFQTKRNNVNVDLLRIIAKTDFLLKENVGKAGFNTVTSDVEFRPVDWFTFHSDSEYSAQNSELTSSNFEFFINQGKRWTLNFGKRYHVDVDDQITAQFTYALNPKWRFRIYERFDIGGGGQEEQEYTITRDLHCWEMDLSYNETRDEGSEIWVVFRLKAFPDQALDLFTTSFNSRKVGSQSGE